jgi:hypothetical protein
MVLNFRRQPYFAKKKKTNDKGQKYFAVRALFLIPYCKLRSMETHQRIFCIFAKSEINLELGKNLIVQTQLVPYQSGQ